MKTSQIIESISSILGKDFELPSEEILFHIWNTRAFLIKRTLARHEHQPHLESQFKMYLNHFDEDPLCSTLDCKYQRTEVQVPRPIRRDDNIPFRYVTNEIGEPLIFTPYNELKYIAHTKYEKKSLHYFFFNGYIYVTSNLLRSIIVRDVIEDLSNLKAFNKDCKNCGLGKQDEFPIHQDMVDDLIKLTIQKLQSSQEPEKEIDYGTENIPTKKQN